MELQIRGRNVEINDQIRSHVTQKLGQLNRQFTGLARVAVELSSESPRSQHDRVVAQVTLDVNGTILRAEQRASNTTTAMNSVAAVLARRIERYKSWGYRSECTRQTPSLGEQQTEEAGLQDAAEEAEVLGGRRLGPRKAIRYVANDGGGGGVPDAALGHQFFMFLNSESDRYNVLYQRGDSNFGLIQPRD